MNIFLSVMFLWFALLNPSVSECQVTADCIVVYLIIECAEPDIQPPQRTDISVWLKDTTTFAILDKAMTVSDTSPNQVVYKTVWPSLNKQHGYQTHLLTKDGLFLDWSYVSTPPEVFSWLDQYTCLPHKVYMPISPN